MLRTPHILYIRLLLYRALPHRRGEGEYGSHHQPASRTQETTQMYPECRHVRPSGEGCRAAALQGSHWCYFHARCTPARRSASRARPAPVHPPRDRARSIANSTAASRPPSPFHRIPAWTHGRASHPDPQTLHGVVIRGASERRDLLWTLPPQTAPKPMTTAALPVGSTIASSEARSGVRPPMRRASICRPSRTPRPSSSPSSKSLQALAANQLDHQTRRPSPLRPAGRLG